ncbi:hypothetical protein BDA96_02G153100 [Sorghum bicolor]|uniref:Uncharacterized protein n=1 Tax=Sorghum bicolor TaxID=4558 RepID=A0A921UVG0_SORBI|nr:hypothetical protein BDA96_02G153100 [Sorghum bicolor]
MARCEGNDDDKHNEGASRSLESCGCWWWSGPRSRPRRRPCSGSQAVAHEPRHKMQVPEICKNFRLLLLANLEV